MNTIDNNIDFKIIQKNNINISIEKEDIPNIVIEGKNSGSSSGSGEGFSGHLITTGDTTLPTNDNVYSALRSRNEFLCKESSGTQKVNSETHFNKDLSFSGNLETADSSGNSTFKVTGNQIQGLQITPNGIITATGIKVMSFETYELIYNTIKAQGGKYVFSNSANIEKCVYMVYEDPNDRSENAPIIAFTQKEFEEHNINYPDNKYTIEDVKDIVLTIKKDEANKAVPFRHMDILYGHYTNIQESGNSAKGGQCIMYVTTPNNQIGVNGSMDIVVKMFDTFKQKEDGTWETVKTNPEKVASNILPVDRIALAQRGNRDPKNNPDRLDSYYIDTTTSNLYMLQNVTGPNLDENSYGIVLGKLPEELYEKVKNIYSYVKESDPVLYAKYAVIENTLEFDHLGNPIPKERNRGAWDILCAEWEPEKGGEDIRYKTNARYYDVVTHNGSLWKCTVNDTTKEPGTSSSEDGWLELVSSGSDGPPGPQGPPGLMANANVLLNSNFDVYDTGGNLVYWKKHPSTTVQYEIIDNDFEGFNTVKITGDVSASSYCLYNDLQFKLKKDDILTFSCVARNDLGKNSGYGSGLVLSFPNSSEEDFNKITIDNSKGGIVQSQKLTSGGNRFDIYFGRCDTWTERYFTFTYTGDNPIECSIKLYKFSNTTYADFSQLKLEFGNSVTPYIKNQADLAGTNPIYADLDNEVDIIGVDSKGKTDNTYHIETNIMLYNGSIEVPNFTITSSISPKNTNIEVNEDSSIPGKMIVKIPSGIEIAEKTIINFEINATIDTTPITRNLNLTIKALGPGANGEPAITYKLIPSHRQIVKSNDGTITPSELTFAVYKYIKGERENLTSAEIDNIKIKYSIDSVNYPDELGKETITLNCNNIAYNVEATLYINDDLHDSETVGVIKDGKDGESFSFNNIFLNADFSSTTVTSTGLYSLNEWSLSFDNIVTGNNSVGNLKTYIIKKSYNGYTAVRFMGSAIMQTVNLEAGKDYVLSVYAQPNYNEAYIDIIAGSQNSLLSNLTIQHDNTIINKGEGSFQCTGTNNVYSRFILKIKNNYYSSISTVFKFKAADSYQILFCAPKLEEGTEPSGFSPNITDLKGITGPAGEAGPMLYPAGEWVKGTTYIRTVDSVPFVYYKDPTSSTEDEGQYYILKKEGSLTSNTPPPEDRGAGGNWDEMQKYEAIHTKFLMANWAKLGSAKGGVFYDRYLFSQYGNGNKHYSEFKNNMWDKGYTSDAYLSGEFVPNMYIDFYRGAIKTSKFSEPFTTIQKDEEGNYYPVIPTGNHTLKIDANVKQEEEGKFTFRNRMIVMPSVSEYSEYHQMSDGEHYTIFKEAGGAEYGDAWTNQAAYNNFDVVCSDKTLLTKPSSTNPDKPHDLSSPVYGTTDGWFLWHGMRSKMVLLTPAIMLKLRLQIRGTETYWIIENSDDFISANAQLLLLNELYDSNSKIIETEKFSTTVFESNSSEPYVNLITSSEYRPLLLVPRMMDYLHGNADNSKYFRFAYSYQNATSGSNEAFKAMNSTDWYPN